MKYHVYNIISILVEMMLVCTTLSFCSNPLELSKTEKYLIDFGRRKSHGITYEGNNGRWHVYGKPDGTGFISLSGGINKIPDWLKTGDILYVSLNGDSNVVLNFIGFTDEYQNGTTILTVHDNIIFKVPDLNSFTGIDIRLQVPSNVGKIDVVVTPCISHELPNYGKPCLSLIDDDGDIHFLLDIVPLCEEFNISISSAVTTTRIGSSSRWMNWDQINDCERRGAEILCHTYSHPTRNDLNKLSNQEIVDRLTLAHKNMLSRGFTSGDILVYSSSTGYEERMRNAAKSIFKAGIVIGGNQVNHMNSDIYNLQRYRIDYATGDGDKTKIDWNLNDLRDYIDVVATTGGYEIMMFHTSHTNWRKLVKIDQYGNVLVDNIGNPILLLDESGNAIIDFDGSKYTQTYGHLIYVPILREIIRYAQENNVEIVTASEGINRYYNK